ncbi:type IV secretion system protein VirB3 [Klebsiella variicola]|jgi:type IV secretion system protein VirB3|uniref:type IV secretion system protein VirB3 n=1 Tax=Enterobacterales TaxID=91347 RepID=UPI0027FBCE4B|nr:hypothetical protein [Salmonella enterica]ELA2926342.1 type IV secretion system protein VirB3 [Klebsiella variicola]EIN3662815.1 type IV secretion system protein VirB3 [Salmonella enterica]EJH2158568.1 type IV secretion system protein VirB3 [Salmonella enterica]EKC5142235.1 type IV secretion system protein VirB3 [Salmonella enterica]
MAERDTLFAGATRPSLVWGVTYEALIICVGVTGIIFLASNSIWLLPLYVPLHAACYLVCLKDPRFFRLLFLWLSTKCRSTGWRYWGAATAAPLVSTRKKRKMPE